VFFSFSFVSWGQIFGVFFAPFPEEEISDYIAHGPIIRVLTASLNSMVPPPLVSAHRSLLVPPEWLRGWQTIRLELTTLLPASCYWACKIFYDIPERDEPCVVILAILLVQFQGSKIHKLPYEANGEESGEYGSQNFYVGGSLNFARLSLTPL